MHEKVSLPVWDELVWRFGGESVLVFGPQEMGPLGSHIRPGPRIGDLSAETGRELLSFWVAQRMEDRNREHFTGPRLTEEEQGGQRTAARGGSSRACPGGAGGEACCLMQQGGRE